MLQQIEKNFRTLTLYTAKTTISLPGPKLQGTKILWFRISELLQTIKGPRIFAAIVNQALELLRENCIFICRVYRTHAR